VRRPVLALIGLLMFGAGSDLLAQTPPPGGRPAAGAPLPTGPGEVRGSVVDANGNAPVARASVAVRNKPAGTLVAGAIAGTDGSFKIQGLRPGGYTLRITFLGFGPTLQDISITPASPVANVGIVKLSRVAVALAGVSVTEERDAVTIEPDRNSYRAKAVAPAATNATEVLEAVPAVQVDGDGKVSLRGNENVAIQINGRPAPITGAQLASYLKSLPANIVDRVEVVPNPSARHDPEGMAGIINIVLKANTDLGMSAGLNLGFAESDRYNGSGNFGYQVGRISAFLNAGFNADRRGIVGINDRERFDALQTASAITEQDIDGTVDFHGQNLSGTLDLRLSPKNLLSNVLSFNHRSNDDNSLSAYSELNGGRTLIDRYDRSRLTEMSGTTFDYNVAFKRTMVPRKHELGIEARANRSQDDEATALWRLIPSTSGAPSRLEGELDTIDARSITYSGQLDYMKTFAERSKIETGFKSSSRIMDRDYLKQKDLNGTGTWARSDLSNDFEFEENVQALYGVLSHGVKKLEMQAGLRAEYASRDFALATSKYPYTYKSLFPSGVVSYSLSDALQAKASYSRRIRRPGTQELNPFPSFFDVHNVFFGNPDLAPEYTDAVELGLTRNGKLGNIQFAPFYRHTKNVIRVDINTSDTLDGREVTSVSFKNLASAKSWGADLNGSLRLGPKFSGFGGFNIFKMVTDGGSSSVVGSDAVTWMARVNGTTELTKTLSLQGMYMYRAPMKIERGKFSAMQFSSFSLRQKLRGDKAIATLRVNDPFNTQQMRIKTGNDEILQVTERHFGVRSIFLTLQFTYGQTPRLRQPRPEEQQQGSSGFPGG
jgi:ferric enterobactin receptor